MSRPVAALGSFLNTTQQTPQPGIPSGPGAESLLLAALPAQPQPGRRRVADWQPSPERNRCHSVSEEPRQGGGCSSTAAPALGDPRGAQTGSSPSWGLCPRVRPQAQPQRRFPSPCRCRGSAERPARRDTGPAGALPESRRNSGYRPRLRCRQRDDVAGPRFFLFGRCQMP